MKKLVNVVALSRTVLLSVSLCGLLVAGTPLSGCGGGSPSNSGPVVTRDAPTQLFGQWQLVRVFGGITGGGYPVTPGTEFLTFSQNGVFFRVVNGKSTQGNYQVHVRKTVISESDLPVITYLDTNQNEVISQISDQRLVLFEESTDGYVREYERVINTGG